MITTVVNHGWRTMLWMAKKICDATSLGGKAKIKNMLHAEKQLYRLCRIGDLFVWCNVPLHSRPYIIFTAYFKNTERKNRKWNYIRPNLKHTNDAYKNDVQPSWISDLVATRTAFDSIINLPSVIDLLMSPQESICPNAETYFLHSHNKNALFRS